MLRLEPRPDLVSQKPRLVGENVERQELNASQPFEFARTIAQSDSTHVLSERARLSRSRLLHAYDGQPDKL